MKLSSFFVENFKCIGSEIHIKIDNIIILIGQNNVGKSTILDAYEKFSALGKEKFWISASSIMRTLPDP
ncbi:AAA family ATPase [Salmonella enterica]|nr:AAA family ATPase [Salmonella enterica]